MKAMEACGFRVSLPPGVKKGSLLNSTEVAFENQSFQGFWKLVFSVLRAQASHLVRYPAGCPFLLAGLLHEQETMVRETFQRFKRLRDAWVAAAAHTSADVQGMRRRSHFNTASMQWASLYAEAGQWCDVTDQMREHLGALFRTIGQSKATTDTPLPDFVSGRAADASGKACGGDLLEAPMPRYNRVVMHVGVRPGPERIPPSCIASTTCAVDSHCLSIARDVCVCFANGRGAPQQMRSTCLYMFRHWWRAMAAVVAGAGEMGICLQ